MFYEINLGKFTLRLNAEKNVFEDRSVTLEETTHHGNRKLVSKSHVSDAQYKNLLDFITLEIFPPNDPRTIQQYETETAKIEKAAEEWVSKSLNTAPSHGEIRC